MCVVVQFYPWFNFVLYSLSYISIEKYNGKSNLTKDKIELQHVHLGKCVHLNLIIIV